jgi:transposase
MAVETKWRDTMYVEVYLLAKQGLGNVAIAATLGVSRFTFLDWTKAKPALADALKRGREQAQTKGDFAEYYAGKLPPEVLPYWQQLAAFEDAPPHEFLDKLFAHTPRLLRQWLWVHAYYTHNFSRSAACQRTGVGYNTLQEWCSDPNFASIIAAMRDTRADKVEDALMTLVERLEPSAVIFASKSLLGDRGYATAERVHVTGEVEHTHKMEQPIDVDSLRLPAPVLEALLEAIRGQRTATEEYNPDLASGAVFETTATQAATALALRHSSEEE